MDMQLSVGQALTVDVRIQCLRRDTAQTTHMDGLDLAFTDQLVQTTSSDPESLRRFRDGEKQTLIGLPVRPPRVPLGSASASSIEDLCSAGLGSGSSHLFSSVVHV
jgi:hypothetical protein